MSGPAVPKVTIAALNAKLRELLGAYAHVSVDAVLRYYAGLFTGGKVSGGDADVDLRQHRDAICRYLSVSYKAAFVELTASDDMVHSDRSTLLGFDLVIVYACLDLIESPSGLSASDLAEVEKIKTASIEALPKICGALAYKSEKGVAGSRSNTGINSAGRIDFKQSALTTVGVENANSMHGGIGNNDNKASMNVNDGSQSHND